MKLYVGNLAPEIDDAQLTALITPFGKPASVAVVMDKTRKESRGFGFVELQNDTEAQAAIAGLNGKEVGGRNLIINEARSRS
jgi:RNA recognition motif-containing protein